MSMTLDEIKKELESVQVELKKLQDEKKQKAKAMKDEKVVAELAKATKEREKAEINVERLKNAVEALKAVNPSDPNLSKYEKDLKNAEKELVTKKQAEQTLSSRKDELSVSSLDRIKIENAEARIQDIYLDLAANPAINDYLKGKFNLEYNNKIAQANKSLQESQKKYDDLNRILTSSNVASDLDNYKRAYQYYGQISDLDYTAKTQALQDLNNARTQLENKLKLEGVANDIILTSSDFEAIAKGQPTLPSRIAEESRISQVVTDWTTKRDGVIGKLEAAKVQTTGSATIPQDLQDKINKNAQDMVDSQTKKQTAEDALAQIATDAAELAQLEQDLQEPTKKQALDNAETEMQIALEKLRRGGYIDESVVPELKTEPVKSHYETFKNVNKALREAFVDFQANPSSSKEQAIKDKIMDYETMVAVLKNETGFDAKAWNKYYMSELAKDPENVDSIFYDGESKARLEEIKKINKIKKGAPLVAYEELETALEKMNKLENDILEGKPVGANDLKIIDVNDSNGYAKKAGELADALGILDLKSLLEPMKNTAIQKVKGIFSKFTNFFRRKEERKFEPDLSYGSGVTEQSKADAVAKINAYKVAEQDYNNAMAAKDPAKVQRFNDLQAEAAKKATYEQDVINADADITRLETEKTNLDAQVAALPVANGRREISDGSNIIYRTAQNDMGKIIDKVAKEFDER